MPEIEITVSRHFLPWLYDRCISLAFTTYQTNRLFLIGLKPDGALSTFERLFDRPMGLHVTAGQSPARQITMSTRYQIWQFEDALPPGETHDGYDRLYVPRRAHTTGDLDTHDVAIDADGRIVFVSTLYSCLATISERYSFKPIWQPPFISRLAPEDRCHLNGLAMEDGQPRYVTTVSRSDVAAGWRDRRHAGGCLIDVQNDEIVLDDLSMPHSPRIAGASPRNAGRVWLVEAGRGEIGYVDFERGAFEPVAFCPGFLRGLAIYEDFALVGLSKPRRDRAFQGLNLDEKLAEKDAEALCGLYVIDLRTGHTAHWLRIEGVVEELYDIKVIPNTRRPMALGFVTDEIQRLITIDVPGGPVFFPLETIPDSIAPPSRTTPAAGVPAGMPTEPAAPPPPTPQQPSGTQLAPQLAPLLARARQAHQAGRLPEAETLYRQLMAQQPDFWPACNILANILVAQSRFDEAVPFYQRTLAAQPNHSRALHNLGTIYYQQGQAGTAIDHYRRAVAADPAFGQAYASLAGALHAQGDLKEAARQYMHALQRSPEDAQLHNQAGLVCYEQGRINLAERYFRRTIELDPGFAEAHNNLGGVLKIKKQEDEALQCYQQAIALDPGYGIAQRNVGVMMEDLGETEAARDAYRRSLALDADPLLELHVELLCPPVAESNEAIDAYRAHVAATLDESARRGIKPNLGRLQSSRAEPPLTWAYQGRDDDCALKSRYAQLFADQFPTELNAAPARSGGRIHLGLVATPGHEDVFMRCMREVIDRLSREKFRLTVACALPGEKIIRGELSNPEIEYLRMPMRFDHAANLLREARFDVLHYWETNTDSINYFLPFCRLAPVQCTGWGWPATSATSQMDYYISHELLSPPGSEAHFTETLVRLPGLPPYYGWPPFPESPPDRATFGLPEDVHLYTCAQNLRKIHPDLDPVLGEILRRDPEGLVVFVEDERPAITSLLRQRLERTLADVFDRICILPRQPGPDYLKLLMVSDVALDPLHFGGALTTYDALAAGLPVVTLPSPLFQRGRYAHACYQTMGILDCTADSAEGYVEIALRLGTDAAYREEISARIEAAAPGLFEEQTAVGELESFFEKVCSK